MFAYCGNNPCNYSDPSGYFLVPYPLITDYYFIHQMVQMLIVFYEGFAMEVAIISPHGTGRLDLYDAEHNRYYEVKHEPQHEVFLTSNQKRKYDSSQIVGKMFTGYRIDESPAPGTRTDIYGEFEYKYWDITYQSHGDGVITYKWQLNKKRYQNHLNTLAVAATATTMGIATGLGGSKTLCQQAKDLY